MCFGNRSRKLSPSGRTAALAPRALAVSTIRSNPITKAAGSSAVNQNRLIFKSTAHKNSRLPRGQPAVDCGVAQSPHSDLEFMRRKPDRQGKTRSNPLPHQARHLLRSRHLPVGSILRCMPPAETCSEGANNWTTSSYLDFSRANPRSAFRVAN
jgi:hypothetical protein